MSNVAEMLQSMSLLGQRERFRVARTKNHHFGGMKFHELTLGRTLHKHSLDLEAHTHVSSLENLLVIGNSLAVHYPLGK